MNKPIKKVPELRFKGFTEDWEQRKLGELANFSKGKGYAKKDLIENGGVPIILYGRLYTTYETLIEHVDTYAVKSNDAIISKGNEVIVPASGESADEIARASAVSKPGIIIGSDLNIIKLKKDINPTFLALLISNGTVKYAIKKLAQGNSVVHLYNSNLKTLKIKYPIIKEQEKVTSFIMKLENAILLHQRKLDALKRLKESYLQDLFPKKEESVPKLRFNNFSEIWNQRKLKDLAEFNPKATLPDEFKYVDLEAVVGTTLVSYRTEQKQTAPSRAKRLAQHGDIFFQTVRPYQKNNYLFDLPSDNYVFSTGYAQIRPSVDSHFLLNRLLEDRFTANVLNKCTGTSYPAINSKDLSQIYISFPNTKMEQIKIGRFLNTLDDSIALHQQKLDQLKKLQKAYFQKLFI